MKGKKRSPFHRIPTVNTTLPLNDTQNSFLHIETYQNHTITTQTSKASHLLRGNLTIDPVNSATNTPKYCSRLSFNI